VLDRWFGLKDSVSDKQNEEYWDSFYGDSAIALKEGFCKSIACAWGHAVNVFPRRVEAVLNGDQWIISGKHYFDDGFDAASCFFNIDISSAAWIFSPTAYELDNWPTSRKAVATRLKVLAKNNGEIPENRSYRYWLKNL
jgi:hypothetical protein